MAEVELLTPQGLPFIPLPNQLAFLQSPARFKSYIGGFGSGKSLVGAMDVLLSALDQPGWMPGRTVVARFTYKQLESTTWDTLRKVIPNELIAEEKRSQHELKIVLKNGWTFLGWNLRTFQDYGSMDLDDFWIDEANDDGIGPDVYRMLCGRLRGTLGDRRTKRTGRLTGNPGGRNWLYDIFFKHKFEGGEPKPNHAGFQAGTQENKHLPPDYIQDLYDTYPEDWVEAYLAGSFDVFTGQILDTLDPDLHLIDDFEIPEEWPRYRGVDHGWTNPTAGLWVATDYDNNRYLYREHYKRCAVPATNAADILAASTREEEMTQWTVIDPSTRQTQTAGGQAQRIVDQYREAGLYCRLGDNDVKASIAKIKQGLQPDETHLFPRWHPRAGEAGAPHTYICRSLKNLWWEAQQWQWKEIRPGGADRETPLARHDHLVACWRYIEMEMPRAPQPHAKDPFAWIKRAIEERDGGKSSDYDTDYIGA